jgi:hypothetical protein
MVMSILISDNSPTEIKSHDGWYTDDERWCKVTLVTMVTMVVVIIFAMVTMVTMVTMVERVTDVW